VEEILKQILDGQKQLFTEVTQINFRLDGVEVALKENIDVSKGLKHWHEEINAQVHGLAHNLNTLTGVMNKLDIRFNKTDEQFDRMANDVIFLVRKASEHEQDIRQLSRAK